MGVGGDAGDGDGLLTDAEVVADTGDFGDEDGDMF
jgi:hypothetical protein